MIGGVYLCYEGAEKLWELVSPHSHEDETPAAELGSEQEEALVAGAIRTDFILSAEIMVISLNEVADEALLSRALILVFVAFVITIGVYGVVGLIVKMDDVGLHLAKTRTGGAAQAGRGLLKGMPIVLAVLANVGIAAMLWVGGHILLVGLDELGVHPLYDFVHHVEEDVHEALGGVGGWLTNTAFSAIFGLLVGAVVVAVMHRIKHRSHA
jgi:predicted DNA repair protein MutK